MLKRSYKLFVEDILESMNRIQAYTRNMNYEKFSENKLVVDAVIRNLEIIGEASKNIPLEIRKLYSEIPWSRMLGLRNIAIHEYFGVDLSIIWQIVTKNIPETKPKIEVMLKNILIVEDSNK
ncbi:MAG: DUF86 domain-containing protein [Nanoarchaeota archaeon]|nr:DUF86 domain-containing protein [Nanoarchaeota archaeon]MBU4300378.1 DUF86 domain-containing protein [Nanoarchaeota archaeon]MBU4451452.1 DUF86 domain-containing protein [Nanoarchaeota archaeon]MCG2723780.1 DUF86 domain-containing protein [archaeon]